MTTMILFNPQSGRGQALRRLRQLPLERLGQYELRSTTHPGHAEELALQAAMGGAAMVVAAGGDGTVHEVANGLLRSGTSAALGVIPIGSANDYSHSLETEWRHFPRAATLNMDVGRVREPTGRERFFVCCLGLGLNGAVTLESRKIRGLQGIPLYGLATLRALIRHYGCPDLALTFDDKLTVARPTLMLSVLVGRREGGFVMSPKARMTDGLFDYVHAGQLSRWEVLRLLPRIALFGVPEAYPKVEIGRCRRLRLASKTDLIVHIDGEFFCQPEDHVRELEIELLPGRLAVRRLFDGPA